MSIGELAYGAAKARNPEAERNRVERLVDILDEGPANRAVMMRFGLVKAELEAAGTRLADADLLIAATALEHDMTLVTGNTKHFTRIPGCLERFKKWHSHKTPAYVRAIAATKRGPPQFFPMQLLSPCDTLR